MKLQTIVFVLILIILGGNSGLLYTDAHADECMLAIKSLLTKIDGPVAGKIAGLDTHIDHRNFIAQLAKKKNIPVFLKQNEKGESIPIILLNKTTSPKLKGLIENSFGTQIALQKDWNNDHGLLRAGNYIIDLDTPGARGFGEIEETGLAWKNVHSYLTHTGPDSSPTLEVAYLLTPDERSTVDYYQKVRRAALFRVNFTFADYDAGNFPSQLKNGGEHCFLFCKATEVTTHIQEIKQKLSSFGVKDPNKFLKDPKVALALKEIRELFNNTDPDSLNSNILNNKKVLDLLSGLYPKGVATNDQKLAFVNWLTSYDSSVRYNSAMKTLGVTEDLGVEDAINSRVSVIFVYDENAEVSTFSNATYSNYGKFISWPTTKQYPVD